MKTKKLLALLAVVAMLFTLVANVVACKPTEVEEPEHEHNYSEWGKNDTQHWKYCPDDDTMDESTKASHSYTLENNTKCVCGATKPVEEHKHSYTAWGKDDNQHWKYCTADNAVDESSKAAHDYTLEGNTKCVCGAFKPIEDEEPEGPIVKEAFNALIITVNGDTMTSVMIEDDGTVSVLISQDGSENAKIELTYEITEEGIITIYEGEEAVGEGTVVGRKLSISIEKYSYEIERDLYVLSMTVLGEEQVAYCAEGSPLRMLLLSFAEEYDVKIDNKLVEGEELLDYVMPAHSIVVVVSEKKVEFKITLRIDTSLATLPADVPTEYMTVDGMLPGLLPYNFTILKANYDFWGWFTASGNEVNEDLMVFTADTEIIARIAPMNGVWVNFGKANEQYVELTKNNGASGDDLVAEYWMGDGNTVVLAVGDELCWYINGIQCTGVWITGQGVTDIETTNTDSVKVTTPGPFKFYLKDYSNPSQPINWVCQCAGPTLTEQGSEIPDGCDPIVIKIGNLAPITFYLQTSTGASVGASDFSKYCIYTFSGEIFGNWQESPTKGVCKSEMIVSGTLVPTGWIFRWGSGFNTQTADIDNVIAAGGNYLVKLPSANKGAATVTVLNLG